MTFRTFANLFPLDDRAVFLHYYSAGYGLELVLRILSYHNSFRYRSNMLYVCKSRQRPRQFDSPEVYRL